MPSLIRELKRRRVLQTAAVYVAAAWAGTEMLGFLLPALNFPRWTVTIVAILFVLGFPVAMLLAWVFDVDGDGIRRTAPSSAKGKLTISVAVAFLVVSTAGLFYLIYPEGPEVKSQAAMEEFNPPDNSIAVLPFVNMSDDPGNVYFSDGIAEELLHRLANNPNLWVTARTSSFQYRDKTLDVRTIGEQLNVAKVLEGSVRKAGKRVRITAQLINTRDGYHDWSETYDRELTDIFKLQDEIAYEVGDALALKLAVVSRAVPKGPIRPELADGRAYDDFLRARFLLRQGDPSGVDASIEAFQSLVAKQPTFAAAWLGLAEAYSRSPGPTFATDELVLDAAKRAIGIDSSLGQAHALIAGVNERRWNWRAAAEAYQTAISFSPGEPAIRGAYGVFLAKTGAISSAREQLAIAAQRDPRSSEYRIDLNQLRVPEDALQLSNGLAAIHLASTGKLDRAYERAWLAIDDRSLSWQSVWFPELADLRTDSRFEELSRRAGLLNYWQANRPPDVCTIDDQGLHCR